MTCTYAIEERTHEHPQYELQIHRICERTSSGRLRGRVKVSSNSSCLEYNIQRVSYSQGWHEFTRVLRVVVQMTKVAYNNVNFSTY